MKLTFAKFSALLFLFAIFSNLKAQDSTSNQAPNFESRLGSFYQKVNGVRRPWMGPVTIENVIEGLKLQCQEEADLRCELGAVRVTDFDVEVKAGRAASANITVAALFECN